MANESKFTGWIAFLSNGDVAHEQPPVEGERSSWQKLLQRCEEEDIEIRRLSLVVNPANIQIMSLPHKQRDGFYQAKEVRRHWFKDSDKAVTLLFQGIGSIVDDKVFITWVSLNSKEHVDAYITHDVRPLDEDSLAHSYFLKG